MNVSPIAAVDRQRATSAVPGSVMATKCVPALFRPSCSDIDAEEVAFERRHLDRRPALAGDEEERPVRIEASVIARIVRSSVVSITSRRQPSCRSPEHVAQHLRAQAAAAHAEQEDVREPSARRSLETICSLVQVIRDGGRRVEPPQPVVDGLLDGSERARPRRRPGPGAKYGWQGVRTSSASKSIEASREDRRPPTPSIALPERDRLCTDRVHAVIPYNQFMINVTETAAEKITNC